MLSREDTRRLAQLESRLRQDDPDFCARMGGAAEGPRRVPVSRRVPISLLLAASMILAGAVAMSAVGWWIGAGVAAVWAAVIVAAIAYRCLPTTIEAEPPVW
jgi:hypothetical protein